MIKSLCGEKYLTGEIEVSMDTLRKVGKIIYDNSNLDAFESGVAAQGFLLNVFACVYDGFGEVFNDHYWLNQHDVENAQLVLCGYGVEEDETGTVMQAIGYAALDEELEDLICWDFSRKHAEDHEDDNDETLV